MVTHRCEGSLKAGISIRYSKPYEIEAFNTVHDKEEWRLFALQLDDEWMSYHLMHVAPIKFCPLAAGRR